MSSLNYKSNIGEVAIGRMGVAILLTDELMSCVVERKEIS